MDTPWKVFVLTVLAIAALIGLLYLGRERGPNADSNPGAPIVLYCAAGVKPPVEAVVQAYRDEYGVEVQIQYGGSGTLLSNLQVATRGDLYVAADQSYVDIGRSKGLINEVLPLARQRPVIAVPKGNPENVRTIADLYEKDLRVSLGSPDAASVGKTTREVLLETGEWERLEAHVRRRGVFKPTVPEIANDVKLGAADAGVVWDTTVTQYPNLETVRIPAFEKTVQLISINVLSYSDNPTSALRFARYLAARDRGLQAFQDRRYDVVDGDVWSERPEIVLFSGGVNRVAIEETLKAFERREGVEITTTFNGCGILVGQMKTGSHPDAYFACDSSYMVQVKDLFLDQDPIAETDMVLLVARGNPLGIHGLADLARPGVKVAVANPEFSALGGLTVKLLEEAGLLQEVRKNITYGDSPTADYLTVRVKTDREDAAIVYRANTIQVKDDLTVVPIDHPAAKAVQPIAIAKDSGQKYLLGRLVETLRSAESRARFESAGFRWAAEEAHAP
jgi:molybdenum ABC transporter molybdate-binding protein